MPDKSRLRQRISTWANHTHQHARDMRETYAHIDVDTIETAPNRVPVRLRGTLRTVTLRPRGGVPALEAELFDGTGVIILIWLGRRRIAGIAPGRSLQVAGRVGLHEGNRVLFNPRYELIP